MPSFSISQPTPPLRYRTDYNGRDTEVVLPALDVELYIPFILEVITPMSPEIWDSVFVSVKARE